MEKTGAVQFRKEDKIERLQRTGIFITGTDTGVGKTFIAAWLAQGLISHGMNVGVMKPIETGCAIRRGKLIPRDARRLKKAAGVADPLEWISPYRFRAPLAPWPASLITEETVTLRTILSAYKRLQKKHTFMIVEGIGGLRVPITAKIEVVHLIQRLGLPVLLVARSGLGTLNHTLLTIQYGEEQGVKFAGVILNSDSRRKSLADHTNRSVLEKKISIPVIGPFPYMEQGMGLAAGMSNRPRDTVRSRAFLIHVMALLFDRS